MYDILSILLLLTYFNFLFLNNPLSWMEFEKNLVQAEIY